MPAPRHGRRLRLALALLLAAGGCVGLILLTAAVQWDDDTEETLQGLPRDNFQYNLSEPRLGSRDDQAQDKGIVNEKPQNNTRKLTQEKYQEKKHRKKREADWTIYKAQEQNLKNQQYHKHHEKNRNSGFTATTEDGGDTSTPTATTEDGGDTSTPNASSSTDDPFLPPENNGAVGDEHSPCILFNFRIVLSIPYLSEAGEQKIHRESVPRMDDVGGVVGGDCSAADRQELELMWNWPPRVEQRRLRRSAEFGNVLRFVWTERSGSVALSEMDMTVVKTRDIIEDLHDDEVGTTLEASAKELSLFEAPKGSSYSCANGSSVTFSDGAELELSDVHTEAFNDEERNTISDSVEECEAEIGDPSPPDPNRPNSGSKADVGVYVAVSVILGVFIIAGTISYVVYQRRKRRFRSDNYPNLQV